MLHRAPSLQDWKALKLPLYPKIVKHPMDLGTVQQKLEAARYAKVEDFLADVELVWKNAKLFNLEGSDIYEIAVLLEEEFKSKLEVTSGPLREAGAKAGAMVKDTGATLVRWSDSSLPSRLTASRSPPSRPPRLSHPSPKVDTSR